MTAKNKAANPQADPHNFTSILENRTPKVTDPEGFSSIQCFRDFRNNSPEKVYAPTGFAPMSPASTVGYDDMSADECMDDSTIDELIGDTSKMLFSSTDPILTSTQSSQWDEELMPPPEIPQPTVYVHSTPDIGHGQQYYGRCHTPP